MKAVSMVLKLCAILVLIGTGGCAKNENTRSSVVRVIARTGDNSSRGTGFFVKDENGRHWVVTNFHVVESGGNIIVERTVDNKDDAVFVEAYPEVRIVKFSAEADIAILELRNVPSVKMPPLQFGTPKRDARVTSWGYPASNLTVRGGLDLTRKEGTISNLVKFPFIDRVTGQIIQDDAVSALVVSTELEPGFSGGPTVDESGRVVGINVLKDTEHHGQNGAIHIDVLKEMLESLKEPSEPSTKDVVTLLDRIQNEYLQLPLSQRRKASEVTYVALDDLPRLREFFGKVELARLQTTKTQGDDISLAARVGHELASLPGLEFESWADISTRVTVSQCISEANQLESFLGKSAVTALKEDCMATAFRMFVWDLVSSTVRWNGKPGAYNVSRVETLSREKYLYKAMVSIDGVATFPIFVTTVSGELQLKLLDRSGVVYAIQSPHPHTASDFTGLWKSMNKYMTDDNSEIEVSETIQIRETGSQGILDIQHTWQSTDRAPHGYIWPCNRSRTRETWIRQFFLGAVIDGQIAPQRQKKAEKSQGCTPRYTEDLLVRLEIHRGELIMYRTDGTLWPEIGRFRKRE